MERLHELHLSFVHIWIILNQRPLNLLKENEKFDLILKKNFTSRLTILFKIANLKESISSEEGIEIKRGM